ncbi:unnamed protein product [Amoebophrya sp. A120]|nr:unnamed protein product [Amoebophrya sp. A120]|eukprot:GSA120T00012587001.1
MAGTSCSTLEMRPEVLEGDEGAGTGASALIGEEVDTGTGIHVLADKSTISAPTSSASPSSSRASAMAALHGRTASSIAASGGDASAPPAAPPRTDSVFANEQEERLASLWPLELFEKYRPRYFDDPVEFIDHLLTGDFLHGVCVLRDGCRKLQLEIKDCFEPELAECLLQAGNVREFLLEIRKRGLEEKYKARVQYLVEKDVKVEPVTVCEDDGGADAGGVPPARGGEGTTEGTTTDASTKNVFAEKNLLYSCAATTATAGSFIAPSPTSTTEGEASPAETEPTTCQSYQHDREDPPEQCKSLQLPKSRSTDGLQADKTTTAPATSTSNCASSTSSCKLLYQKEVCKAKDLSSQITALESLLQRERESSKTTSTDHDAGTASTSTTSPPTSAKPAGKIENTLYMTELRYNHEIYHPLQRKEKVRTSLKRDMRDVCAEYGDYTLYWDRYDEGVFLGGDRSGKALHIDQILWQNIGKNWTGYKLLAAWPVQTTSELLTKVSDCLFLPRVPVVEQVERTSSCGEQEDPRVMDEGAEEDAGTKKLKDKRTNTTEQTEKQVKVNNIKMKLPDLELSLLQKAAAVCLIKPGDVFYFTGGVPHVTLSVTEPPAPVVEQGQTRCWPDDEQRHLQIEQGEAAGANKNKKDHQGLLHSRCPPTSLSPTPTITHQLNICAYESIITLNKTHVAHFLSMSNKWKGFDTVGMEKYEDMAMPENELEDVKDDMVERLTDIADRWIDSVDYLEDCHIYLRDKRPQFLDDNKTTSSSRHYDVVADMERGLYKDAGSCKNISSSCGGEGDEDEIINDLTNSMTKRTGTKIDPFEKFVIEGAYFWAEEFPNYMNVVTASVLEKEEQDFLERKARAAGAAHMKHQGPLSASAPTTTAKTTSTTGGGVQNSKIIRTALLRKNLSDLTFFPSLGADVDEIWKRLRKSDLLRRLQYAFIETVNLCLRDEYFRNKFPKRIYEVVSKMEAFLERSKGRRAALFDTSTATESFILADGDEPADCEDRLCRHLNDGLVQDKADCQVEDGQTAAGSSFTSSSCVAVDEDTEGKALKRRKVLSNAAAFSTSTRSTDVEDVNKRASMSCTTNTVSSSSCSNFAISIPYDFTSDLYHASRRKKIKTRTNSASSSSGGVRPAAAAEKKH